jgi:hypothetical protein
MSLLRCKLLPQELSRSISLAKVSAEVSPMYLAAISPFFAITKKVGVPVTPYISKVVPDESYT